MVAGILGRKYIQASWAYEHNAISPRFILFFSTVHLACNVHLSFSRICTVENFILHNHRKFGTTSWTIEHVLKLRYGHYWNGIFR